jgi:hypothetical protein
MGKIGVVDVADFDLINVHPAINGRLKDEARE